VTFAPGALAPVADPASIPEPSMIRFLVLATALAASAWLPAPARADIQDCTVIASLPTVITVPGIYCLQQDLGTNIASGTAIDIAASNVTLDCNDHKIGGLGGGAATQAVGIGSLMRNNVTVRNCNVRGFWVGIALSHDGTGTAPIGALVEDNRLVANTRLGVFVAGNGSLVRRNVVGHTGGNPDENAIAVETHFSVDVLDNTIDYVFEAFDSEFPHSPYGIVAWNNTGGTIQGNRIRNVIGTFANPYGIMLTYDSHRVTLRRNVVRNPDGAFGQAIHCVASDNLARDNSLLGFYSIEGCSDGGGNVHN
jgi:hypothetical protein